MADSRTPSTDKPQGQSRISLVPTSNMVDRLSSLIARLPTAYQHKDDSLKRLDALLVEIFNEIAMGDGSDIFRSVSPEGLLGVLVDLWERIGFLEAMDANEAWVAYPLIMDVLRILRALVGTDFGRQNLMLSSGWIENIVDLWISVFKHEALYRESEAFEPIDLYKSLAKTLNNCMVNNEEVKNKVHKTLFQHPELIMAMIEEDEVASVMLVLLICFVRHNRIRGSILKNGTFKAIMAKAAREDTDDHILLMAKTFPMIAWELHYFEDCLSSLDGPNLPTIAKEMSAKSSQPTVSMEQLACFDFLYQSFSEIREDCDAGVLKASHSSCLFLVSILRSLNELRASYSALGDLESPILHDLAELLVHVLEIIGYITQTVHTETKNEYFVNQGDLLSLCNEMLVGSFAYRREGQASGTEMAGILKARRRPYSSMERAGNNHWGFVELYGIQTKIVKVVSNLAFENPYAQDEMRRVGLIPTMLSLCRIDDDNPFVREYAIFALRNMTKDNQENQEVIAKLEARTVVDNGLLKELGLEPNIVNGKLHVTPRSRTATSSSLSWPTQSTDSSSTSGVESQAYKTRESGSRPSHVCFAEEDQIASPL